MEDCTRVLVYGSFDGFAYSTDDSIAISVVLDSGEKVEIPEEFIVSADQMINKYKIKLKDVIERIEKFDLGTKAVWINEILYKLGSDYGMHKYYAGYKQGKFDGAIEHEKVAVPQFVADWIEVCKEHLPISLYTAMNPNFMKQNNQSADLMSWIEKSSNQEIFTQAWIFGYTVEKEKRYLVKVKGRIHENVLVYGYGVKRCFFSSSLEGNRRAKHTRKELEENGFGEVFNSPLFEVEEVE